MLKLNKIYIINLLLFVLALYPAKAEFDAKVSTAIVQDYLSGEILFEKEADRSIYPASMTKIMTTIVAFDLIKNGDLKLEDKILISEKAKCILLDFIYVDIANKCTGNGLCQRVGALQRCTLALKTGYQL